MSLTLSPKATKPPNLFLERLYSYDSPSTPELMSGQEANKESSHMRIPCYWNHAKPQTKPLNPEP